MGRATVDINRIPLLGIPVHKLAIEEDAIPTGAAACAGHASQARRAATAAATGAMVEDGSLLPITVCVHQVE